MERNLFAQKGLMLSENVMMHLANRLGRMTAHGIVYKGAMEAYEKKYPLRTFCCVHPKLPQPLRKKKSTQCSIRITMWGLAPEFVDRVVAKYSKN